jgi:hypothetical protein
VKTNTPESKNGANNALRSVICRQKDILPCKQMLLNTILSVLQESDINCKSLIIFATENSSLL